MEAPSLHLPHYYSGWQTAKIQKSFKLCLAQEKLEFQEALNQVVSTHAY